MDGGSYDPNYNTPEVLQQMIYADKDDARKREQRDLTREQHWWKDSRNKALSRRK